jgi:hypothetical protein
MVSFAIEDLGKGTNDSLAIIGIGKPYADRLVDEKDIGIRVPPSSMKSPIDDEAPGPKNGKG